MESFEWPPTLCKLYCGDHSTIDAFYKGKECVVLSVGLLQMNFKSVCHGMRATFMWAKRKKIPIYIRHLEDYFISSDKSYLQQLLLCLSFAKSEDITVVGAIVDKNMIFNCVQSYFTDIITIKQQDLLNEESNVSHITFNNVIGRETIKMSLLSLFKSESIFEGILFHGLPGKGKTMMVKALYGELKKNNQISLSSIGIHNILKSHIGEGESALRAYFSSITSPTILFIDEMDALLGNDELFTLKLICQLNSEIDKLQDYGRHKVLLIGATNFIDSIPNSIHRRLQHHILFD